MKLFDCFMYNNEETLLDIRFQTLSKYVQKFILVESEFDHQGNKKDKLFNIEDFKKYKDKIIFIIYLRKSSIFHICICVICTTMKTN